MTPISTTNPRPAWDPSELDNPHAVADKRSRVQRMFASIAPCYDLNNRLHSFWQDQRWRKKAVRLAAPRPTDVAVDVACGTGDLTLAMHRGKSAAKAAATLGIDFTFEMLPLARDKSRAGAAGGISWINGDAQALPLPDACCDVVSIAFGIRNVQEPSRAIAEFFRILRPGGRLVILEFSQPTNRLLRWCNDVYCARIMPRTATWISGDRSGAYAYLPQSVKTFLSREHMVGTMQAGGFADVRQFPLTFGVCVCYRGIKP